MSDKKSKAGVKSTEELAAARLEGLEPDEGRIGKPPDLDVRFVRVYKNHGGHPELLPKVVHLPEGSVLVIYSSAIPEEYREEYLRQRPGAKFMG